MNYIVIARALQILTLFKLANELIKRQKILPSYVFHTTKPPEPKTKGQRYCNGEAIGGKE